MTGYVTKAGLWLWAGVAAGLFSGTAWAQEGKSATDVNQPTTTLHVTTRLVVLDVVVVDKAGRPVPGLDKSQFSVTENRVPQTIRNFDPPSGHTMPATTLPIVRSSADLTKIGNAPVNILVFDELNTKWDQTAYARQQMEKFLKAQPEVLTVPTLLVAAGDARFVVLHDYTQSRADLLEAIRAHFPAYPFQMMRGNSGNSQIERMEQTLGTLSQLAESSRGTPGRKNVIWVGSGYPGVDMTTLQFDDEDKLMAVIKRVTDRMLSARVTLYMVDPQGPPTTTYDSAAAGDDDAAIVTSISNVGPYTDKLDFATFATATGGEIFSNRNDLDVAIGQGVREGGVYYTLTYSPTGTSEQAQAYRQIRVRVKDKSLRVYTRDGYFPETGAVDHAPAANEKPAMQLKYDIVSAAQTRLVYNGLGVTAAPMDGGYQLLAGARDLRWSEQEDGTRIAEVTVMTVFFNAKGKELQSRTVELKERIGPAVRLDAGSQIPLKVLVDTPAGTARVRFVVRDAADGTLGTADLAPAAK